MQYAMNIYLFFELFQPFCENQVVTQLDTYQLLKRVNNDPSCCRLVGILVEIITALFFHFSRTNLPKEIMELSGYHHKGHADKSYIAANDVLQYLNDFADNFDLRKYIKVSRSIC